MKFLSREVSTKEKLIILALIVILLVLVFVKFVRQPLESESKSVKAEITDLEDERDLISARVAYLDQMQRNLDNIQSMDYYSYMPSYNAGSEEVDFLNDVLDSTISYYISFSDSTLSGDQFRRNFNISFTVKNYEIAADILNKLVMGDIRCEIGNLSCQHTNTDDNSYLSVTATATFYETMYDGEADSALPVDMSATDTAQ